jgi:hypothetical protein
MVLEEVTLSIECNADRFVNLNIPLPSVNNWDVAKSQRDDSSCQNVYNVGSLVPVHRFASELDLKSKETYIRSTFVKTPIVLVPSGSTSRAIFSPSEFAKSVFAAVTARMIHAGFWIYLRSISRICFSMSRGWSPTGTLVRPGRSTRVSVRTLGEYMRRLMG